MHAFLTGVVNTMHVQVCTLDRCCDYQSTHCLHARYRMCACAHVRAVCSCNVEKRGWGGSASLRKHFFAWRGGYFDRRKDRGDDDDVDCVFSILNAGGSVRGCMCVYTHTHTHTTQMGYLLVSPGVGMRHMESWKNPDRLKRSIHVDRIGVQSTFVYIYTGLQVLMIWANCFLFF